MENNPMASWEQGITLLNRVAPVLMNIKERLTNESGLDYMIYSPMVDLIEKDTGISSVLAKLGSLDMTTINEIRTAAENRKQMCQIIQEDPVSVFSLPHICYMEYPEQAVVKLRLSEMCITALFDSCGPSYILGMFGTHLDNVISKANEIFAIDADIRLIQLRDKDMAHNLMYCIEYDMVMDHLRYWQSLVKRLIQVGNEEIETGSHNDSNDQDEA